MGNILKKKITLLKAKEYKFDTETTNSDNNVEVEVRNKEKCEQCNKEFVNMKGLLRHKTEVHIKIKPFK